MATTPTRVRRLFLRRVHPRPCVHVFRIVIFRGRMFLKCDYCTAETETFVIHRRRRPRAEGR